MKSFSQNGEDLIVLEYFNGKKLNLLSVGENDGITLSNAYALIQSGWTGTLIEPSRAAFESLISKYPNTTKDICCLNIAIDNYVGKADFYESGHHLGADDISLLSTINEKEMDRWAGTNNTFEKTSCEVWNFSKLCYFLKSTGRNAAFNYISIDAEGSDLKILKQIDLNFVCCQCLCIEWNGSAGIRNDIEDYVFSFGMKLHHENLENLIFVK